MTTAAPLTRTPDALPADARPAIARPAIARPARARLALVPTPGPATRAVPVTRLVEPGVPALRPVLAPGPRPGGAPATDPGAGNGVGAAGSPNLVAHRLLTMTLEAFSGLRPLTQLRGAYTLPVFTAITRGRRPAWCTSGSGPLLLGAVRVAEPVEGVAEVCAVARRNGRAHAVAARLEVLDGRWRCTALQVG
jgi:hypothetical protein